MKSRICLRATVAVAKSLPQYGEEKVRTFDGLGQHDFFELRRFS